MPRPKSALGERAGAAGLDGGHQLLRHGLAQPDGLAVLVHAAHVQKRQLHLVQRVVVGHVGKAAALHQARDDLDPFAHAVDAVEGAAARPMEQALQGLRRAVDGDAAAGDLAFLADDRRIAAGAALGHMPRGPAPSGRRDSTGPSTSGMTSPALRTMTVLPTRTSLRCTSSSLCRVARATVEPATTTGSSSATGRDTPVRPTCTVMSRRMVRLSSGGNLNAMAQRGARAVYPMASCWQRIELTFTTTPSIS